jgi:hypothetical protein
LSDECPAHHLAQYCHRCAAGEVATAWFSVLEPDYHVGQRTDDYSALAEEVQGGVLTRVACVRRSEQWTFARTMPEWPHEYIVRGRVDDALFERLVAHIQTHGSEGRFYAKTLVYFEEAGRVYWSMGAPLEETTIVNRCLSEETDERRLADGRLP